MSDQSHETVSLTRREFLTATVAGMATGIIGCTASAPSLRVDSPFDTLIKNGMLIDGSGSPATRADLGIKDKFIAAIGDLRLAQASRVIDATGLTVVPGFIDIHSHVDTELFRYPKAESKVRQGVTTEVTGMDGESEGPMGGPELERRLAMFREEFGFDCPYRDMAGFFHLLEQKGTAQNILSYAGLGSLREVVVGMDNRVATDDEIKEMQRLAVSAIEQGCWGVSTGLEYTPGSFASTEELARVISAVPARYRVYATHMRNEDNRVLEAIEEAITIARSSGARLQISHLKAQNKSNWHKQKQVIALLEQAIATGMDVHADRYPYIAYSTGLSALFPLWCREGGTARFLARLADTAQMSQIRDEVQGKIQGLGSWDAVMISSVERSENKRYQGRTIQNIVDEEHVDPFEFASSLLRSEEARVGMVGFGMDEEGTELVLAWKNAMVASDAGSYTPSDRQSQPHPRSYGTFPRAIARYQRERHITTLPDMIRKMTSLPAAKLGLTDRGLLAVGKAADIVVFDYATIQDRATYVDPHQFPVGIPHVFVNGVAVVDDSVQTDALPGRVLRGG